MRLEREPGDAAIQDDAARGRASLTGVGVDYAYFSAHSDAEAATTIDRVGGPATQDVPAVEPAATEQGRGWWRRRRAPETRFVSDPSLPVLDHVELRGIDPLAQIGTLEALLTGRTYEQVDADERNGLVVAQDEDSTAVVTLTDSVRDALASADGRELDRVVDTWLRTEEFAGYDAEDRQSVTAVLGDLAALARRARADDLHLYCWMSA